MAKTPDTAPYGSYVAPVTTKYDQTAAKAASLAASQKRQALIDDPRNASSKPFVPGGE